MHTRRFKPDSVEYQNSFDPRLFEWCRHISCAIALTCCFIAAVMFYHIYFPIKNLDFVDKSLVLKPRPFPGILFFLSGLSLFFFNFRVFFSLAKILCIIVGIITFFAPLVDFSFIYFTGTTFLEKNLISFFGWFSFLLLSGSLYFLKSPLQRGFLISQILAIFMGSLSLFIIYGYTFDLLLEYDWRSYTYPSLTSCVLYGAFTFGLLLFHPTKGISSIFTNKTLGGYTARRFILIPIFGPFIILLLRLLGEIYLKLSQSTLYASGMLLNMFLLTVLIVYYAGVLWKADLKQKQALANEIELNKRIEKLTRSRTELEQLKLFSFATTHDLKEPLHKILLFSDLIKNDSLVQQNETLKNNVEKINETVEVLRAMISQLHEFALISISDVPMFTIDLNELLEGAIHELDPKIKMFQGQIIKDKLPSARGIQPQIKTVFINLITNALIFHRENVPPVIRITGKETEDLITISIEDNGVGIAPQYFDAIFEPFFRLHTSEIHTGKGLGLPMCKRIIQRHGGEIFVESTLGAGTTFTFTLPKKQ